MMACAHPGGCVRFRMASRAGGREGALQGPPAPPSGPTAAWRRRKAAQQHSGHAPGGVEGAAGTRRAGRAGRQRGKRSSAPGHRALAVRVSPHQAPFHSSLSPTKTHRRAAREALWATGVVDLSREADTMAAGGWRLGEREARREGREAKRETRCEWGVGGEPLPLPFRAIGGVHAAAVADQPVARAHVNFNPIADPRPPRHLEHKDAARRPGSSDPALGHLRPARSLLTLLFFQPCQPHTPACASCSPPRP